MKESLGRVLRISESACLILMKWSKVEEIGDRLYDHPLYAFVRLPRELSVARFLGCKQWHKRSRFMTVEFREIAEHLDVETVVGDGNKQSCCSEIMQFSSALVLPISIGSSLVVLNDLQELDAQFCVLSCKLPPQRFCQNGQKCRAGKRASTLL
nr:hypothetical protein CFP56_20407 [Quercus suber]